MEKTKNVDVMLERELPAPFRMLHLFERKPHYAMDFHQHETFYHVNLVLSGEVRIIFKNETASIRQNQVFVVPPGLLHQLQSNGGYRQFGIDLLPGNEEKELAVLAKGIFENQFAVTPVRSVTESFFSLEAKMRNPMPFHLLNLLNFAERIVIDTMEAVVNQKKKTFSEKITKILREPDSFRLSVTDICRHLNYSKSQIERISKKELGCGLMEFFNNIRINEICTLLRWSDMPLAQIAEKTGLYDASHLITFFKRHMGTTPGKYRKERQN